MTTQAQPSRSQVRRLPDRGHYDDATVHAILDAGFLAHVGFTRDDGQPFVIPTLYGREGHKLYLHGSSASRMVRHLTTGVPACVTVTHVDALVFARSAFHHSMNYRSVVAFGTAKLLETEAEKEHALAVISDQVAPARWRDARPPTSHELKATGVLEFLIEEASAKIRTGPPKDDPEDMEWPVWAGIVPVRLTSANPVADGEPKAPFNAAHVRF